MCVYIYIYLFVSLSTPFHAYTVLCIHYIFLFFRYHIPSSTPRIINQWEYHSRSYHFTIGVRLVGMNHPTPTRGGRICIYSRVASLSYRTFCFHRFLVLYYMMWQRFQNFTGWTCPYIQISTKQQPTCDNVALEAKNTTYWEFWLHGHMRKFRTCIHDIHINAILGKSRSKNFRFFFREND